MATQVLMPKLGESVVEGTVNRWLVEVGSRVEKMAPLVEISTDKVDTEIPSPASGVLLRILAPAGKTVPVGSVLALIGEPGEMPEAAPPAAAPAVAGAPTETVATEEVGFISPVVARLAAEHGLDLSRIRGTGLKGRIRKQDVLAYLAAQEKAPAAPAPAPIAPAVPEAVAPAPTPPAVAEEVVPLNRIRRLIAEHMVRSKHTAPHVTTVFDCDMTAVVRHRYAHQEAFARDGVDLTFTPYFIAAVVAALKAHPYANAAWSEEGIILKRAIHIGLAVAIPDGLIVPVIHHADSFNLLGLARAVNDLARRAREGQLKPDEIQGGTFTITNHGTSGSLFATPIIHQPQTGILGIGRIHKEPVVISRGHPLLPDAEDVIAIRPVAYLSFSFDHRVLDGATADAFVSTIKTHLENWPG
ncbi:MAG: dihydrolipoamide acetyltransferase family protein [Anaerolineae bacterium]|nr:2-oxo acid dehydrogenase subunit E2 [Caldilineales bacterium]MDW8268826.1 dihydrolipoamide acetyltransferase family protein [Anaerolineae bacterium]